MLVTGSETILGTDFFTPTCCLPLGSYSSIPHGRRASGEEIKGATQNLLRLKAELNTHRLQNHGI
jgi:hypothetical protein